MEEFNSMTGFFFFVEVRNFFLKEIKFYCLGNEILKIFENEEEYSNEVIKVINCLLSITRYY